MLVQSSGACFTAAAVCVAAVSVSARADLLCGGTSAGPEEAQELHLNTLFAWSLDGQDAESVLAAVRKQMEPAEKVGVKYFWAYAFKPSQAAAFSEYVESGRKCRALETGYSWLGPLGKRWLELVEQRASWKLPIIYNFVPDEMYYNNAHIPYTFGVALNPQTPWYPDTPEEKAAFEKATGLKFPRVTASRFLGGDTPENRALILFRYRTLAETVKTWHARAKAVNPDIQTTAIFNLTNVYGLERYPSGFTPDLFGDDAGLTYVAATAFQCSYDWRGADTHYYPTETVKHLMAGFPKAKVIGFTSGAVWEADSSRLAPILPMELFPPLRPIDIIGTAMSTVGHGAEGYLPFAAGDRRRWFVPQIWEAQKMAFRTLEEISPWLEGSRVPGQIVLLHSRAGEDWYALAHEPAMPDPVADGSMTMRERSEYIQQNNYLSWHMNRKAEFTRGFRAQKNVAHFLFKNAMPFRLHYLDSVKAEQIADAKVILLPFSHAVGQDASDLLHKAVADGKKVILFGMLGERNPEGEYYPKPLLADLIGNPNVRCFDAGVALDLSNPATAVQVRKAVLELLGDDAPIQFDPDPKAEVEVALREKSPDEKVLFLVNWSETIAKVKVGLALPKGTYSVMAHDTQKPAPFKDGKPLAESDLANLPLEIPPLSAMALQIKPAGK